MAAKVFHIPLITTTPSFNLAAIVQRSPSPDNSAPTTYPDIRHFIDAEHLFKDESIDIVIVTTPPNTHFDLASKALQAGKHVLVEKPFVPTAAQAEELIKIAKESERLICVYQNRRWDSDFLTFRELQKTNKLGRIVDFESHFDRYKAVKPDTWKGQLGMAEGGGVLYDLGTHLLDQIVLAFGVPKAVTAVFKNERGEGEGAEPDAVKVICQYDGQFTASANANVMAIDDAHLRFWVRGTEGTYKKYHLDCQEDQLKAGMVPGDRGFGVEDKSKSGDLTTLVDGKPEKRKCENVQPETYGRLYRGFAEAIKQNREELVPVKASEARDVLRVIEAAKLSAKEGRTVNLSV